MPIRSSGHHHVVIGDDGIRWVLREWTLIETIGYLGPEPKSFPQLWAATFAWALTIPSSAAAATATVLFRKSLRCIGTISAITVRLMR